MTAPKPRPIGPIPPFRLAPGTRAFQERLEGYFQDADGQLLVQAIIDRKAAREAHQHRGLVPVQWSPEVTVIAEGGQDAVAHGPQP